LAVVVEDEKAAGHSSIASRRGTDEQSTKDAHQDVNTGMIYSNVVAAFIIITTTATLGAHGKTDIVTAQQAAQALRPLAGNFAALLFTLGFVVLPTPQHPACGDRLPRPGIAHS
jgi:Mn2+/Fe2+ NRAMP family transporter